MLCLTPQTNDSSCERKLFYEKVRKVKRISLDDGEHPSP